MKKFTLLVLTILLIPFYVSASSYKIRAYDIGDTGGFGDAAVIESDGKYLLMDTGLAYTVQNHLVRDKIFKFDIYLSHYHEDHYGQVINILKDNRFTVSKIYLPKLDYFTKYIGEENKDKVWYKNIDYNYQRALNIINLCKEKKIEIIYLDIGSTFEVGSAKFEVLYQNKDMDIETFPLNGAGNEAGHYINNASLVTKVWFDDTTFLTAGDIEIESENEILKNNIDIKSDIYKLSHHGWWTSNQKAFVDKVNPKYSYVPGGSTTKVFYNEWTFTIDDLLQDYNMLCTRYNGDITINIDDNDITFDVERNVNTITIKCRDSYTGNIIKTKKYVFSNGSNYFLEDYEKLDGYKFDKDDVRNQKFVYSGVLDNDLEYSLYYKKIRKIELFKLGGSYIRLFDYTYLSTYNGILFVLLCIIGILFIIRLVNDK